MPLQSNLNIDDLIDEIERAYSVGLVGAFSVSENTIRIDLSPKLHYSKTYDLFGYLQDKYHLAGQVITNVIVLNSHSLLVYF